MKTYLSYSLILAAAASGMASGAETAYTAPVGYVGLGNTAGIAIPAKTDMSVAIPLDQPSLWAGTVASVSGNVITLTGTTGFTLNQWVSAATPYVAKITSGAKSGQMALITASNATTLTVAFQNTDSLASIVSGDRVTISLAWTIKNFFAGNTLPDNIEFSLWEGVAFGTDNAPDKVYYYFGGSWYDSSNDVVSDSVVLYPNEGFKLRNTTNTGIAKITVTGQVPVSNSRVFSRGAAGAQDTRISCFSPVDEPIATSGLGAADNDQLLVWSVLQTGTDNAPAAVYYKFGSAWYDSANDADVTATLKLKAGLGYVYRAAAGTASSTSSNLPDYVPSL